MNRSSRRATTFAWTLILALIVPILAACGGTTTTPTTSAPASTAASAAASASTAASPSAEASASTEASASAEASASTEASASAEASTEASAGAGAPAESPINDKIIVVGMDQEIDTFFGLESNALATTEVLSPMGLCSTNLSYDYQTTYCFDEFPRFDNGGAVTETVQIDPASISPDNAIEVDGLLITDTAAAEEQGVEIPSELDQLTLTWKLNPDLKWDDGTPVTAADVVESYRVQKDPETLLVTRQLVDATKSLEAVDDQTVKQVMVPGYLDFTYFIDPWMGFLPSHLYQGKTVAEIRDAESARPTSFGPYMFQEHEPGVQTTLVSNPYFPTQPKVGTLIFKYVADNNQLLAQLETGEIDLPTPSGLTLNMVPQLDELESSGKIKTAYIAGTFWEHLDFGIQRGDDQPSFFEDVRVRQAVAYGINRDQIVNDVQYGKTKVMNTIIPDDHPAYPSGLEEYKYDADKAKSLLDEAGATDSNGDGVRELDGRAMEMTLYTTEGNAVRQAVAEIIQQNLNQIGIKVNLEFVPGPEKLFKQGSDGILSPRLFDLAMYAYLSGVQPSVDLYYCDQLPTAENSYAGQNNPGYCNPDYDRVGKAAQRELDIEKWPEVYAEPLTIINRDLPTFPLYQRLKIGAFKEGITGVTPDPTQNQITYNTEEWDISQ